MTFKESLFRRDKKKKPFFEKYLVTFFRVTLVMDDLAVTLYLFEFNFSLENINLSYIIFDY